MSREFVDAIADGNTMEEEKFCTQGMARKVGNTLEVKRKELSSTFVKSMSVSKEEENESEV